MGLLNRLDPSWIGKGLQLHREGLLVTMSMAFLPAAGAQGIEYSSRLHNSSSSACIRQASLRSAGQASFGTPQADDPRLPTQSILDILPCIRNRADCEHLRGLEPGGACRGVKDAC